MPIPLATRALGLWSWSYNRANFMFDATMRWARFTTGRTFACEQVNLFREDIEDLMSVPIVKAPIYVTPMAMTCAYCVTVLVEGRSGLKFPAPPTFASGMYLQCLAIGFGFVCVGIWLAFHAAFRAHIGAVQLRTRKVRVPVPTQRQLDGARKISSDWELQPAYDQLRLPFVMPHMRTNPLDEAGQDGNGKKDKMAATEPGPGKKWKAVRAPGRAGMQTWNYNDMSKRKAFPKASDVVPGMGSCPVVPDTEPLEHFEYVRQVQKEYWSCETYTRICMLYGKMHLIQAFNYWLVIHNIAELGLLWCANICAVALSTALWLIWHLDVVPERAGLYPIEAMGPNIACITLTLQYTSTPSKGVIDFSRGLAMFVLIMQIVWTARLFVVARPANPQGGGAIGVAKESGGLKPNQSGACEQPSWLPMAFQPVQYLVAPPKPRQDSGKKEDASGVNMKGWIVTRALLLATGAMWFVLLAGRVVEAEAGERMLVSQPGNPPWSRIGLWNGWEWGPISSKHYMHVTPVRGHFFFDEGMGPSGFQEIWPSDLFGFHPEADAHWRRLRSNVAAEVSRPVVPAAVTWPTLFEPEFLACAPGATGGQVAAFTANGYGAVVPPHAAAGVGAAATRELTLLGLEALGPIRGVTWTTEGLILVAGAGNITKCPTATLSQNSSNCSVLKVPDLPLKESPYEVTLAVAAPGNQTNTMLAAIADTIGEVRVLKLDKGVQTWEEVTKVSLPISDDLEQAVSQQVASLQLSPTTLMVTSMDGVVHQWTLNPDAQRQRGELVPKQKQEAPSAGGAAATSRTWRAACEVPDGRFVRLASRWRRTKDRSLVWQPELLV